MKSSFFGSVLSGVTGAAKGALGLGLLGAAVGAVIATGAFFVAPAALAAATTAIGSAAGIGGFGAITGLGMAAGLGAVVGGSMGMNIGAPLGAITGIVKSRESQGPEAQDVLNVANMAFAQGVAAGRDQRVSQHSVEQVKEAAHAQRILAERAQAAQHARA